MATTLEPAEQNAACDLLVDRVDLGEGTNGTIEVLQGATVLGAIALAVPAFGNAGAVDPGKAALLGVPLGGVCTVQGNANAFRIKDKAGTVKWSGSVSEGGGGGDIIITNTDLNVDDPITITAYSFTVAAVQT